MGQSPNSISETWNFELSSRMVYESFRFAYHGPSQRCSLVPSLNKLFVRVDFATMEPCGRLLLSFPVYGMKVLEGGELAVVGGGGRMKSGVSNGCVGTFQLQISLSINLSTVSDLIRRRFIHLMKANMSFQSAVHLLFRMPLLHLQRTGIFSSHSLEPDVRTFYTTERERN